MADRRPEFVPYQVVCPEASQDSGTFGPSVEKMQEILNSLGVIIISCPFNPDCGVMFAQSTNGGCFFITSCGESGELV